MEAFWDRAGVRWASWRRLLIPTLASSLRWMARAVRRERRLGTQYLRTCVAAKDGVVVTIGPEDEVLQAVLMEKDSATLDAEGELCVRASSTPIPTSCSAVGVTRSTVCAAKAPPT